jgi:hypothetical protein
MWQPKLSSLDRWHCFWPPAGTVPKCRKRQALAQIPPSLSRLKRLSRPSISPQRRVGRKARAPRPRPAFRSKSSRPTSTIRVGFTFFQTVTFSSLKPMLRRGLRTNPASRAGFLEESKTGQVLAFRAQPYHLVARRRRRRCRGDANGFSSSVEFTIRHGARGP